MSSSSARSLCVLLLVIASLASDASDAAADDPMACIARASALIQQEDQPATRLMRASCEEEAGRLVEAQRDLQQALENTDDAATKRTARTRIGRLAARIPQITLEPPESVGNLVVSLDRRPVAAERLGKAFPVNPGPHTLTATASIDGIPLTFDTTIDVPERAQVVVPIALARPAARNLSTEQLQCVLSAKSEEQASRCFGPQGGSAQANFLSAGQLHCLLGAKNQEEVSRCLPHRSENLVVRLGFETSGYTDTTAVNVLSPAVNASVSSPTTGWNVGGSYLVDIVSAASPDIVSEASPPFHEIRQAGTVGGGYKPGLYGVQANGNVSREPDYLSMGAGLAFTADLNEKLTTPRLALSYSHDTIGRSTTPFSVFHHNLDTVEVEAGCTFVMSPKSVLLLSGTGQFERGDQSKPYRYVPLFDPSVAPNVRPGQSIASVNAARESIRPLEQLPLSRDRYAVGARFAHRFASSTLRLEERLYYDSWQQAASTTDFRWLTDVTDRLRIWPHLRFNVQSAVSFYRIAYSPVVNATTNQIAVPAFRTGDREDSRMWAVTGGAGTRYVLTASGSSPEFALTLQADVLYSKYLESLFITSRTAVYGTLGLDVGFE